MLLIFHADVITPNLGYRTNMTISSTALKQSKRVRVKRGNGMTEAEKRKRNGGSGKEGKTRKKG